MTDGQTNSLERVRGGETSRQHLKAGWGPRTLVLAALISGLGCLVGCDGEEGPDGESDMDPDDGASAPECRLAGEPNDWAGPWEDCDPSAEPGFHICTDSSEGRGTCADVSVRETIETAQERYAELSTVSDLYNVNENDGESGNIVYAFLTDQGGFRLVFLQGMGDCPSGCTTGTWTYVETTDDCEPEIVGVYRSTDEGCSGDPMWGMPCDEQAADCE